MSKKSSMILSAVSGLVVLGMTAGTPAIAAGDMEKCFGVAKAGKNDCQTKTSSCAGTSTKDGQADAWIFVAKGSCEKIVGGTLVPEA